MSPFQKQQRKYTQKYRAKWEHIEAFKDWLKPLPRDSSKAYCSVCNVVIKAHLCDLRKHGIAKKHLSAAKLVKSLKNLSEEDTLDLSTEMKQNELLGEDENVSEEESTGFRWAAEGVECLLKHLKTYWKDFRDGHRKKKDIWEDVSAAMAADGYNISSYECGKKFRNIKLRYYSVLEKSLVGESSNFRIEYFNDLHELLENDPETIAFLEQKKLSLKQEAVVGDCFDEDTLMLGDSGYDIITDGEMEWTETSTHMMLDCLLEFKDFFSGKEGESDETVWQNIAEQMHLDGNEVEEMNCRRKWQNLCEQYTHYKAIAESTGTLPLWPYYTRVRHVLNTVKIPTENLVEKKPMRVRVKRGRGRRKKRTISEATGDSDGSRGEAAAAAAPPTEEQEHRYEEESIRRMRRLGDSASLWHRLNSVETRLDELCDQQEIQRHTNSILAQILTELSTLANNLSPRNNIQDSVRLRDGITIVVPNSEQ